MLTPSQEKELAKKYIKIGNFNIKKSTILIAIVFITIVFIGSAISNSKEQKEQQQRLLEAQSKLASLNREVTTTETLSYAEQIQKMLREKYGEPPEGFEWGYTGELIALGTEDLSQEDVIYTYIRALSILDFATAQRVASSSSILDMYNEYFGVGSQALADYYNNFLRKQFRVALQSVEIDAIEDIGIFADGTAYITVRINCIDLTNKDFWQEDREEIFNTMRFYDETEMDSVKKESYVYDYIYQAYLDNKIGKHSVTVDFVVDKLNAGGWLISNDSEFKQVLSYESGVDVAAYIMQLYNEWYRDKKLEESVGILGGEDTEFNYNPYEQTEVGEDTPNFTGESTTTDTQGEYDKLIESQKAEEERKTQEFEDLKESEKKRLEQEKLEQEQFNQQDEFTRMQETNAKNNENNEDTLNLTGGV